MNFKKPFLAAAVVFLCLIILAACAKELPVISSAVDSYTVTACELVSSFDGITASEGQSLLLIQIEGGKNVIENIEQDFFSYQKVSCQVSDGTYSAPCRSVAYSNNDDKISAILIFEVPQTFGEMFSLIGDTIGVTELKFKRS